MYSSGLIVHVHTKLPNGYGASLLGTFQTIAEARTAALDLIEFYEKHIFIGYGEIELFTMADLSTINRSGYAKDNWHLTPEIKEWMYYKEDKHDTIE